MRRGDETHLAGKSGFPQTKGSQRRGGGGQITEITELPLQDTTRATEDGNRCRKLSKVSAILRSRRSVMSETTGEEEDPMKYSLCSCVYHCRAICSKYFRTGDLF